MSDIDGNRSRASSQGRSVWEGLRLRKASQMVDVNEAGLDCGHSTADSAGLSRGGGTNDPMLLHFVNQRCSFHP
jgi:hypothetical protein